MSKLNDPQEEMTKASPYAAFAGDMTEMQKEAAQWMAIAMPRFPGMSNLAAHPIGAMAAASAIGMGMAGQMYGMMAGAMAGAMQASKMLANETTGGHSEFFGAANPLNFDPATGGFDDTRIEDPITHQPPVKPDAPQAEKSAAAETGAKPKAEAPAKPEVVARKPAAEKPAAAKSAAKPEPVALEKAAEAPSANGEAVMPEDFVKPKPLARPDAPDDLKQIAGIGPKLESVLNSLGIWTYGQIAALTQNEVAWVDDYLQFKGRIERDKWIAQAAELAKKG